MKAYLTSLLAQIGHDLREVYSEEPKRTAGFVNAASVYQAIKRLNYTQSVIRSLLGRIDEKPICPPGTASSIGFYIGGQFIKLTGNLDSIERLAANDELTNHFTDAKDPFGVGIVVGAKFTPWWSSNIVVSPFASFDYLNASVNHTFPNGSFLGTTENYAATFGVKVGPQFQNIWLYGIAGVSAMNETMKVNFIPVASSADANVAGGTVGAGIAFQPSFLQTFSHPVSLFAEYQHTWWQDATFRTPAASPFFNYTFRRQDDVVKLGFMVSFGAPPPAAAPSYPVKALPAK